MEKPKIVVICGPTASGKTALGIEVANKMNGQIISCDSMQIYKKMNIGTAKPTEEERKMAKHYLVDFVEPDKRYSVADFKKDAEKVIKKLIQMIGRGYQEFQKYISPQEKLKLHLKRNQGKNYNMSIKYLC